MSETIIEPDDLCPCCYDLEHDCEAEGCKGRCQYCGCPHCAEYHAYLVQREEPK